MYSESEQAKASLITAMTILLAVDTAIIAARVYVRAFMIKAFGWDDATLCIAFLGYVIACIMGFTAIHFGYAYGGPPEDWPNFDSDKASRFLYANQLTLYLANGVAKLAVALVLYRLAVNRRFKIMLLSSMAAVALWTFVTTIFASWICIDRGVSDWANSSKCTAVGLFRTISNVFIDYFYALLPTFIVRNAKMSNRMKVSVCILLGLGMFASAATIAKLVIIAQLSNAKGEAQDILHYQLLIWADVELGLTVFCASAAALRPLLRKFPAVWGSANTQSSHTASGRGATAAPARSASRDPLSVSAEPHSGATAGAGRDPSHAGSSAASGGPSGIQEYELSQMDSDRSLEQQKGYGYQHIQSLRS